MPWRIPDVNLIRYYRTILEQYDNYDQKRFYKEINKKKAKHLQGYAKQQNTKKN